MNIKIPYYNEYNSYILSARDKNWLEYCEARVEPQQGSVCVTQCMVDAYTSHKFMDSGEIIRLDANEHFRNFYDGHEKGTSIDDNCRYFMESGFFEVADTVNIISPIQLYWFFNLFRIPITIFLLSGIEFRKFTYRTPQTKRNDNKHAVNVFGWEWGKWVYLQNSYGRYYHQHYLYDYKNIPTDIEEYSFFRMDWNVFWDQIPYKTMSGSIYPDVAWGIGRAPLITKENVRVAERIGFMKNLPHNNAYHEMYRSDEIDMTIMKNIWHNMKEHSKSYWRDIAVDPNKGIHPRKKYHLEIAERFKTLELLENMR